MQGCAMSTSPPPARGSLVWRLPIIGRILRDIEREPESIFYLIVGLLSLLIIATVTWGLQVLAMTALAMVPVIFVLLLLITRG